MEDVIQILILLTVPTFPFFEIISYAIGIYLFVKFKRRRGNGTPISKREREIIIPYFIWGTTLSIFSIAMFIIENQIILYSVGVILGVINVATLVYRIRCNLASINQVNGV